MPEVPKISVRPLTKSWQVILASRIDIWPGLEYTTFVPEMSG